MRRFLLCGVVCFALAGCFKPGKPVPVATGLSDVDMVLITVTPEGAKVYRFNDGGRWLYVVVGKDGSAFAIPNQR